MSAAQKLPPSLSDLLSKLSLTSSSPPPSSPSPLPSLIDWSDEKAIAALRADANSALTRRIRDEEEKQKRHEDDDLSPSADSRKDALLQGFTYVDPLTTPARLKLRSPSARSTSAATEDEEERRWAELERREERERQQSKREERKEPAPAPSSAPSGRPPPPVKAAAGRPAKVDFEWLLQRCESFTSRAAGHPGLSSFDLASSALHLLQSSASDDRLQSELLDLLGMEAVDLIGELLSHRPAIKLISKSELNPIPFSLSAFLPTSSSPLTTPSPLPPTSRNAPPQLLGVTVVSQRERDLDKARRKEDRRMARHSVRDVSSDAVARQRAVDAARLEEQATSLIEWRSDAIQARGTAALPAGSKRTEHKGYEEVYIPPMFPSAYDSADLIPVSSLDAWARPAFPGTTNLNRIQSKVFPAAYKHNNNILVCAPTGAGQ